MSSFILNPFRILSSFLLFLSRKIKSNIANHSFLKRKLDIVKRGEFEERLHIHMYQKASLTLFCYVVLVMGWGRLRWHPG